MELVHEAPVRARFFDDVQVLALDVFDEGHLEQALVLSFGHFFDGHRHAQQTGPLGGAPASFAGDDLIAPIHATHDDGLDEAGGFDRGRKFVNARFAGCAARLIAVWRQQVDVDLVCLRSRRRVECVGDECAESLAQGGSFLGHGRQFVVLESSGLFWAAAAAAARTTRVRAITSRANDRYASAPRDLTS